MTARLGAIALLLYVPHLAWHVVHHEAWDLLWGCNLAMPILVIGCVWPNARMCVWAFLFLAYGTPVWLLDVVSGGAMVPTSPLVHLGGLAVGVLAVRALGWPRHSWLLSALAAAVMLGVSYAITPPASNVNLVFRVYEGWERWFPNHAIYLALVWLGAAVVFFVLERTLGRRYFLPPP